MAAGLHLFASAWALPELIEAAARSGNAQVATDALHRLAEMTQAGGTDFGLGLEALAKIFAKLGIGSRRELHAALASLGQPDQPT